MTRSSRKVVLYICHSLDGYIAEADGGLDWLENVDSQGTDCGYAEFTETIDTAIIGKTTYEQMLSWNDPLFNNKQCFVVTQSLTSPNEHVQVMDQDISSFVQELKQQDGLNIWLLGGGQVASSCLDQGLIDEMIISIIPMTLGKGIPLFRDGVARSEWDLKEVRQYGSIAQLHYVREESE